MDPVNYKGKIIITLHQRCIRLILKIWWQHKITNEEVLRRTGLPTIYTKLSQRRLRWLCNVLRMSDELIPKAQIYSELVVGKRNVLLLLFIDVFTVCCLCSVFFINVHAKSCGHAKYSRFRLEQIIIA